MDVVQTLPASPRACRSLRRVKLKDTTSPLRSSTCEQLPAATLQLQSPHPHSLHFFQLRPGFLGSILCHQAMCYISKPSSCRLQDTVPVLGSGLQTPNKPQINASLLQPGLHSWVPEGRNKQPLALSVLGGLTALASSCLLFGTGLFAMDVCDSVWG